jgi:hypothetical protein
LETSSRRCGAGRSQKGLVCWSIEVLPSYAGTLPCRTDVARQQCCAVAGRDAWRVMCRTMLTIAACTGAASPISLVEGRRSRNSPNTYWRLPTRPPAPRGATFSRYWGFLEASGRFCYRADRIRGSIRPVHFSIRLQTNPGRPFSQMRLIGMPRHSMAILR